jgi:hypothetical protein
MYKKESCPFAQTVTHCAPEDVCNSAGTVPTLLTWVCGHASVGHEADWATGAGLHPVEKQRNLTLPAIEPGPSNAQPVIISIELYLSLSCTQIKNVS